MQALIYSYSSRHPDFWTVVSLYIENIEILKFEKLLKFKNFLNLKTSQVTPHHHDSRHPRLRISMARRGRYKPPQTRSVLQLSSMMRSTFGFAAAYLSNYGNYCGFNGDTPSIFEPIDTCDHCCLLHDKCYEETMTNWCIPYTTWYSYENEDPIICTDQADSCNRKACDCDRILVNCLIPVFDPGNWLRPWSCKPLPDPTQKNYTIVM